MRNFFMVWALMIVMSFAMIGVCANSALAEEYPTVFQVTNIDEYNDIVYLTDFCGNLWLATGIEDYEIGDIVAAIMDDNSTDGTIYDDIIVTMRYCGYIEGWE